MTSKNHGALTVLVSSQNDNKGTISASKKMIVLRDARTGGCFKTNLESSKSLLKALGLQTGP